MKLKALKYTEYGINEVRVVAREASTSNRFKTNELDLTHLAERQDKASSETRLTETRRRTTPARPRFTKQIRIKKDNTIN